MFPSVRESLFLLDRKEFSEPLSIEVVEVAVGDTPETLINRADGAFCQAKQKGRNTAIFAAARPPERSGGPVED